MNAAFRFAFILTMSTCATSIMAAEATDPGIPVVTISYEDLDLKTEAGIKALAERLANAAKDICNEYAAKSNEKERVYERCLKKVQEQGIEVPPSSSHQR